MPTYTLDGFYANLTGKSSINETVCIVAQGDNKVLINIIPYQSKTEETVPFYMLMLLALMRPTEKSLPEPLL